MPNNVNTEWIFFGGISQVFPPCMNPCILLWYLLTSILAMQITEAVKIIGIVIGRSHCTVRERRTIFNRNKGSFPDTLQGKYQQEGVLWKNEELNRIATNYIRENNVSKGRPNLTASSFCQWVNDCLLPTHVLEPGYPRRVSVVTARKWLHGAQKGNLC